MGTSRLYIGEPRHRRDHEVVADVMDIIARTAAAASARPIDTPAVSSWTGAPKSFAELDRPTRVNAAAMAPHYESLGVRPDDRAAQIADWRTQAVASLPRDPAAKIGVFAGARFPELPVADAMARYGAMGDRIFYIDRDGTPKWEEPSIWMAFDDPRRVAAAHAGPSVALGGAALGGAVAGIPGAAGGAALADMARQYAAAHLTDEQMSLSARAFHTAMEAGAGAGGRYIGDRLLGLAGRYPSSIPSGAAGIAAQLAIRREANKFAFDASRAIQGRSPERDGEIPPHSWLGVP